MKKISAFLTALIICVFCAVGSFAETDGSDGIQFPELTDPSIKISQTAIPTVTAGTSGNISVMLENTSFSYASDLIITVSSADAAVRIEPENSIIKINTLSAYEKTSFSFPVTASPSAKGTYSINMEINCKSSKDFFTQAAFSFSGSVSLVVERGAAAQMPVIKNMKFNATEFHAGDTPVLSFTVENPNAFTLYSVSPTLSGFVDGAVDNADPDKSFYIDELNAGEARTFTVKMKTSAATAAQIYNFTVDLKATDSFGTEYSATKSAYFTIVTEEEKEPDEFTDSSPRLIIDSYKMKPSSAQPGDTVTLEFNILNLGALDAKDAKIILGGYEASYITLREVTSYKDIGTVACMQGVKVSYSMTLSSVFPLDTAVPMNVTFTYGDLTGKNYSDTATINIMSVSPKKAEEAEKPEYVKPEYKIPKVIIDNFNTDVELISAGTEFTLTFTLKNTSEELDVENLRIILLDSGTASTGGVFTPVNSGYSFFIDKIEKLGTHTLSIPLFAKVSTESGIYAQNFSIDYEYYTEDSETTGSYKSNSLTETVSLKVVQPINIEINNFYCEATGYANGQSYISFMYNNKSRSNLYFMNIDIEGDATFADGKQEMGSIPSGYSDSFDTTILLGESTGEQHYNIVFTFKDSLNQESQIKYPFTIIVNEAPVYEEPVWSEEEFPIEEPPIMPEETGMKILGIDAWIIFTAAGVVLVIIVVIVIVAVVSKKKKAKEAEDSEDESI